ncbi:MAG: dihydropteroate synthase [Alphaproteobacteria bacterium]
MQPDTAIVAIINITPDSFSDGGEHFTPQAALAAINQAIADGTGVVDIGAESTRPGAAPLRAEQEWQRLAPVLAALPPGPQYSLDTYHPENASRALQAGVHWINDVSGFSDPAMVAVVKDSDCKLVVMHSLGVPADKHVTLPAHVDVIEELIKFANGRFSQLHQAGISKGRLIFDPGIGFGKTAVQSQEILRRASELKMLGVPLFIGHSRKSFLGMQGSSAQELDHATLQVSRQLVMHGVDYLRVHNVRLHKQMMQEMRHVA